VVVVVVLVVVVVVVLVVLCRRPFWAGFQIQKAKHYYWRHTHMDRDRGP